MASQISIINVALGRLGANEITSLTEGTTEQKLAVNAWDIARRACLRDHTWNFATKDVELNRITGYVPFEFQYAYQLPSNNVRLLRVHDNPIYKVQGRQILCNEQTCKIKYIADISDTSEWDASFTDVIAQRLAADIAFALTKSQSSADSAYAIYGQKLKTARSIDGTEDVQDMLGEGDSVYIGARF